MTIDEIKSAVENNEDEYAEFPYEGGTLWVSRGTSFLTQSMGWRAGWYTSTPGGMIYADPPELNPGMTDDYGSAIELVLKELAETAD